VYLKYVPVIRRLLPGVPTIDAFDQELGDWFKDACDIKVLQLGKFDNMMEAVVQQGKSKETWYYTCLFPRGQYPNRFIDFSLLKTRILHCLIIVTDLADTCTGAAIRGGLIRSK